MILAPKTQPMDTEQIAAYLRHLRNAHYPATTIRVYGSALANASRSMPFGLQAEPEEIEEWLGSGGWARNTKITYHTALKSFYAWMRSTGRMFGDNPMDTLRRLKRRRGLPRPATETDLATLVQRGRGRIPVWCLLAARAGLRCCEIATLDRDDVTERTTIVNHGKGDRQRAVPTHPDVWAAVKPLPAGPIAQGRSAARVSERINREADRLGIPAVTAHRLRHLAGTTWQRALRDIRVTQQLLGHASPATTAVYTDVADDDLVAAVLAAPSLNVSTEDVA